MALEKQFEIEFRGTYLNLKHGEGFEISPDLMEEFWVFLADLCERYQCSRVLAEGPPPVRNMDTVDAFHSGILASEVASDLWLALCFKNYQPDEVSELFIRAARNRGVRVKFFDDRERALNWLGVAPQSADGQSAPDSRLF